MLKAKDIIIKPISSKTAGKIIKAIHYSGSVCQNSKIHFGVFLNEKCGGALQFGPPMDKRKTITLVKNTRWNGFLELNRMALAEWLPKNGESRAISICLKIIKKRYPFIKWVVSYADGTQCGDGTIYRASGFYLTSIKKNTTILLMPNGKIITDKSLNNHKIKNAGWCKKKGAKPLPGFQLRYIYFIDKSKKKDLTVPILPFSAIKEFKAGMYKGIKRVPNSTDSGVQPEKGGANPTHTLQTTESTC